MKRLFLRAAAVALLLAGCATEGDPSEDLPLPPAPPTRAQVARAGMPPPARPRPPGEAEPAPGAAEAPRAGADPSPPAASPSWRVVRDGTQGCADPAPLRLLRQGLDTPPRVLAEARAAGGCRTTFRVNAWALEATEGDMVRLRLQNGPALSLWFLRADVVAP
jgi:hypothetical protein